MKRITTSAAAAVTPFVLAMTIHAAPPAAKPRARDLGLSTMIGGRAGTLDAITDVAGVEVGATTLIDGEGPLVAGKGPVRTGVTVVHPRGRSNPDPVFGGWFSLNGNGEMTGTTWLQESGVLEGPIGITNTHSVGVVRDAILQWQASRPGLQPWGLPVVAETYDGELNDINGFHVTPRHVFAALDTASGGAVAEGNVGGGTGMRCLGFKAGTGTASRVLGPDAGGYTVGVLVQCNFGLRQDLRVAGVPVGQEITDLGHCIALPDPKIRPDLPRCDAPAAGSPPGGRESGSIIAVVATDAPLLPHQLKRIATRVALGVGRTGGFSGNGSGDIFVAFSTANPKAATANAATRVEMVPNDLMNPLFVATVQATEEAILNAMLAADTMTGANGLRMHALPHDRLMQVMRKYGRAP